MAALVSASKDGAFLTAILEQLKVQPVRGSSSRRGAQALLELTTWAERGYDLAITPDGPRGPRYVVQEGTPIGKNSGEVIRIGDTTVLVKETYVDYLGEATTKEIEMRVRSKAQGG